MRFRCLLQVLAGLVLATWLDGCTSPESCRLETTVNVPVTFVDGVPTVLATVSGQRVRFMIDTGAAYTLLTPATVDRLKAKASRYNGYVVGIGGPVPYQETYAGDLKLDGLKVTGEDFVVVGLPQQAPNDTPIDGIIGVDILAHFNIALDFPHDRFLMFRRGSCASSFPFHGEFASEPLLASRLYAYVIPVKIDGHEIDAAVDTGAARTLFEQTRLTAAAIEGEEIGHPSRAAGIGGKTATVHHQLFASVVIGGEEADGAALLVADTPARLFPTSVLGEDYLRYHQVYISQDMEQIWLGTRIDPSADDK